MQNRQPVLSILLVLCWLSAPTLALYDTIPGLYIGTSSTNIDSITLWNTTSPSHSSSKGFRFTFAWRSTIPAFIEGYPAVRNFKSGPDKMMSFYAYTTSRTQTGAILMFYPRSNFPGIVYMSFSIVIVTENNNYVELLPIRAPALKQQSFFSRSVYIEANSTKFTFGRTNNPYVNHFIQWIQPQTCSGSYYFETLDLITSGTPSIRIAYRSSATFDVKVFVLLVATSGPTGPHIRSQRNYGASISTTSSLVYNLGVNTNYYGDPLAGGHCMQGLIFMRMNCRDGKGLVVSFLFEMSGSYVSRVSSSNMIYAQLETVCFGVAKVCPSNCNTCPNATECSLCNSNFYLRQDKLCYSTCLASYYQNISTRTCDSCPSICHSCLNLTYCTSCISGSYLRPGNYCYSSCLEGYYQN